MQASSMHSSPEPGRLQALLVDRLQPATVLDCLKDNQSPSLAAYRAQALIDLDRCQEAPECLEPVLIQLEGSDFTYGGLVWSQMMLRMGWADAAILTAQKAVQNAGGDALQAVALGWVAVGYAQKRCWR